MPGLSGLKSPLVSTCSGTKWQPIFGISCQCRSATSDTCSVVAFRNPKSWFLTRLIKNIEFKPFSSSNSVGPVNVLFPIRTFPDSKCGPSNFASLHNFVKICDGFCGSRHWLYPNLQKNLKIVHFHFALYPLQFSIIQVLSSLSLWNFSLPC